ncbi:unnamed protein product [Rotaria sp. Silwood1]|nr:unnamed protein product [Rotaria sp. Silwood1]CAF3843445.1 unnamed protein product [Rotaria sp. Silwood1]CAF3865771.1 unnamed protein product [Rotaria sp. Silwood1]CAF3913101.1 unnamed protein product [Rotaria sp. Silwood1]CAF4676600.1 unnamed protein product [Rotaria sp. Silwood1]
MITNDTFEGNDNNDDVVFHESEISIPRPIRFWLLLLFDILSIICSLFLLFHLLFNKTLRCHLINQLMIVLLIIGLIIELADIQFYLNFLRIGIVQPAIPFICILWWFMDLGLYNGYTIIMAWSTIHRYLFIFHDQLIFQGKKRFLFHYLPLIILLLYILTFYIKVIIFPPCMHIFDYTLPVCNDSPCYLNNLVLGIWDSVVNSILPTFIICIFSVIILIRVHYQKRHVINQRNRWRKERKMAIQLISSSVVYLIPNIPLNLIMLAHLCGLPESVGVKVELYFDFLCYFVIFLYPFICLGFISDVRKKIQWRRLFLLQRPQQNPIVRPQ